MKISKLLAPIICLPTIVTAAILAPTSCKRGARTETTINVKKCAADKTGKSYLVSDKVSLNKNVTYTVTFSFENWLQTTIDDNPVACSIENSDGSSACMMNLNSSQTVSWDQETLNREQDISKIITGGAGWNDTVSVEYIVVNGANPLQKISTISFDFTASKTVNNVYICCGIWKISDSNL